VNSGDFFGFFESGWWGLGLSNAGGSKSVQFFDFLNWTGLLEIKNYDWPRNQFSELYYYPITARLHVSPQLRLSSILSFPPNVAKLASREYGVGSEVEGEVGEALVSGDRGIRVPWLQVVECELDKWKEGVPKFEGEGDVESG
jgi:hypothetical protein